MKANVKKLDEDVDYEIKTTELPELGWDQDIQNSTIKMIENWNEDARLHGDKASFVRVAMKTFKSDG